MKNCTAEQWADYLSDIRVYPVEYIYGAHSVMYSRLSDGANTGMDVGEVHYCANGDRFYYILTEVQL